MRLVNLSLGFELCFYDGMDSLAKVGIQLLFPAYLFFYHDCYYHSGKVFLKNKQCWFFCCQYIFYSSPLLYQCRRDVHTVKTINGINGTYYGWYTDPNFPYGQVFHGFLVFVAVFLILVYILPFSIALLLPPLILRTRFNIMLKPLLDAFWNPFKPKFRFWLGFRAILRIIPFFFAVLISPLLTHFGLPFFWWHSYCFMVIFNHLKGNCKIFLMSFSFSIYFF